MIDDPILLAVALFVAGFLAGVINTLSGGGSLLALPALVFAGLPIDVANGTNRVGVLLQSVSALGTFRGHAAARGAFAWAEVLPASLGAIIGSAISLDLDENLFRRIVGGALLVMLGLLLLKPNAWLQGRQRPVAAGWRWLGFFVIGVYGGFLQAGVGMFLLAGLVMLSGRDLVQASVAKVLLVAIYTAPALVIFLLGGRVAWLPGLAMAAGGALGGWAGARFTVAGGAELVRWVLIVVVIASSLKLLAG